MSTATQTASASSFPEALGRNLPSDFLNCYAVLNASALTWDVNTYVVERIDGEEHNHRDRGGVVSATWDLWRAHKQRCRAPGFVVDFAKDRIAVPRECCLPANSEIGGYRFVAEKLLQVSPRERKYHKLVCGILRETVKRRFGFAYDGSLGPLWDLKLTGDHCWFPDPRGSERFHFCRKFRVLPKFLAGDRLVLQIVITTATIDAMSFHDYYRRGDVAELASMIEAKQSKRGTKDGEPPQIRVLWNRSTPFQADAKVVELVEPDAVKANGSLSSDEQHRLGTTTTRVREYMKKPEEAPLSQLFLILDPQITLGDHSETIIQPAERLDLWTKIRESLDGADAFGAKLRISETPLDLSEFEIVEISPPAVRVRDKDGGQTIIDAPNSFTEDSLRDRARRRDIHIRRHGFLYDCPIRPLLGWPDRFGHQSAERMKRDLNFILKRRRIPYSFDVALYRDAEDLRRKILDGEHDSLLAVLPEGSSTPQTTDDTHDQIKRRIDVPSQCIQIHNTLPRDWVGRPHWELKESAPNVAKRVTQRYELTIDNLLVKRGWVPFVPIEPFFYNSHVGIDVGGRDNNRAMACLGYGFVRPTEGLAFLPHEIPVQGSKAEPIPVDALLAGLGDLFDKFVAELSELRLPIDLDRMLFIWDGELHGADDRIEALRKLHGMLLTRGIVSSKSLWTVAEIHKRAECWRWLNSDPAKPAVNPLVGLAAIGVEAPNEAIVCTTGRPYLTQGTAQPFKLRVRDVYGTADIRQVLRDIVWGADLGYTKPDMGRGLPWVLHVADTCALHASRSYYIAGITA